MTRNDPQTELAHHIARLNRAWHIVPDIRHNLHDRIEDACQPGTGGTGSGLNRPTEAAAARIEGLQTQDRAILQAIRSIGRAIDHLELECARSLGTNRTDTSNEPRCPRMTLRVDNDTAGPRGTVMVRCGQLTAAKSDQHGNPIGWDPDGYCAQHRAEADADRRTDIEHTRRQRRRGVA